ncbi:MAG: AraC family transcriptional regulator, partial [Gammaproteobacteria bacterium]|nr:AraC family transcriptional regulator [Gammaproteobacteria bacterium]
AGYVRVGPIAAIPDLLRAHASETPEQILAELDIDRALFDDPENTISYVKGGQLFKLCAKHTDIPHFGLLVGQHAGLDALGRLSEFAIHSPDTGSALHNIILHLCIHDRGGIPTLTTNNSTAVMGFAIYQPMQGGASQICMCSMAIICNIMRALCGETWVPSQVLFTHSQPDDIQPYTSLFNAKLIFNADMNAMIFPDHWLQKSIPGADPQQYQTLVEELTTIKSQVNVDLLEEIRSLLYPLLVSGKCSEADLAHVLSMHPRTLNRRLKERETTFRSLIADTRYEISKQLLAESKTSILRISIILGYADASVFTRAFRRWSGMPPKAWRTQNRI